MTSITTTEDSLAAFETVIEFYQEHKDQGSLDQLSLILNPDNAAPQRTRMEPGVTLSDFLSDVEIQARRVLTPEELRFFQHFYKSGNHLASDAPLNYVDRHIRRTLGERFIKVGIHPLSKYASN